MVKALEDIMFQFAAECLLDGDASGDKTECVVFPVFC